MTHKELLEGPFTADDFNLAKAIFWNENDPQAATRLTPILQHALCEIANARLRELITQAPLVTSWKGDCTFDDEAWYAEGDGYFGSPTHTARLVMIERLR